MSRSEAKTKRRKVFVNEYSDGLLLLATKLSRKEALDGRGCNARTVRFIESRPGDVVLSREDKADMLRFTDVDPSDAPAMRLALAVIRRTLRGGR